MYNATHPMACQYMRPLPAQAAAQRAAVISSSVHAISWHKFWFVANCAACIAATASLIQIIAPRHHVCVRMSSIGLCSRCRSKRAGYLGMSKTLGASCWTNLQPKILAEDGAGAHMHA